MLHSYRNQPINLHSRSNDWFLCGWLKIGLILVKTQHFNKIKESHFEILYQSRLFHQRKRTEFVKVVT